MKRLFRHPIDLACRIKAGWYYGAKRHIYMLGSRLWSTQNNFYLELQLPGACRAWLF